MSLVYAIKTKGTIFCFSDTKITFDENKGNFIDKKIKHNIDNFGILKSYIYGNFFFAFAGEIKYANSFIEEINNCTFTINGILAKALKIHKSTNEGIDFIFGFLEPSGEQRLFQVKNGEWKEVCVSYIGDKDAFEYFQKVRNGKIDKSLRTNNLLSYQMECGVYIKGNSEEQNNEYRHLFDSFYKTINDSGVETVGLHIIPIAVDLTKNVFYRPAYNKNHSYMSIQKNGFTGNLLEMPASKGAYSVFFYETYTNVLGIYISQGKLGAFFVDRTINSNSIIKDYAYLSIPSSGNIVNLDFYIRANLLNLKIPQFVDFNFEDINGYLALYNYYRENEKRIAYECLNKIIEVLDSGREDKNKWNYDEIYLKREELKKEV